MFHGSSRTSGRCGRQGLRDALGASGRALRRRSGQHAESMGRDQAVEIEPLDAQARRSENHERVGSRCWLGHDLQARE